MPTIVNVDQTTIDINKLADVDSGRIDSFLAGQPLRLYQEGWEQILEYSRIRRDGRPGSGNMEIWTSEGDESYAIPLYFHREEDGTYTVQAILARSSLA